MTDQLNDPFSQMEADLGIEVNRARGIRAVPSSLGENVVPIGASAVSKRLEDLIAQVQELHKRAETLALALAGPAMPEARGLKVASGARPVSETLFSKQLVGLDELGRVLDSIGRAMDRANASLA